MHLFGADASLVGVHYFSALAHHLKWVKPGVTVRHEHYADVLRATGVSVQFGNFKQKQVKCRWCKRKFTRHEEKETDVAVAMKVLEIFHQDCADRVVLVTGDTDIAPAVRTAKALYPTRDVRFLFPWNRKMKELAKIAGQSFTIDRQKYVQHQLPDPLIVNGRSLAKPSSW
ncbi:MAG TPA: NYN domain-containing protein [Thermoanaerobaculia bacterium]|nr:NYN domain-containing protein [Thermoanaerobaculia bacterium]